MFLSPLKISPLATGRAAGGSPNTTYYLWGQSNAKGDADMAGLQAEYVGTNANIQVWNGSAYESIDSTTNNNQFPVSQQTNKFGPEFSFGKRLSDSLGEEVYLQKYAVGGSYLRLDGAVDDWNDASVGEYYDIVQGIITSAGDVTNGKAVIWVQGEADSGLQTAADAYYTNLTNFINGMRTYTGISDLKFIIVLMNDNMVSTIPYGTTVRAAMCKVRETMANVVTINPNTFEYSQVDLLHYTADGYDEMGDKIYLEETGTSQTQIFDKLLIFQGSASNYFSTARANIDTSVFTGVRPTFTIHTVYRLEPNASATNNLFGLFTDASNWSIATFASATVNEIAKLTLYSTSGLDNITSNANSIKFGVWMSVSFSIDGTDSKVYINKVDETATNQIDNTTNYGEGDFGTTYTLGQYYPGAPSGDALHGKLATWSLIDYAISKAEHDSLTGTIVNNQIQPVKVGSVINASNIVSIMEDNYSWNGSAIAGEDSWLSTNMAEDDITIDSVT